MDEEFLKLFDKYKTWDIEEGILYVLVKGNLKVYLSYFDKLFDMDDWDNDEAVVSVFRDHLNILYYGGDLDSVLNEVKKILN